MKPLLRNRTEFCVIALALGLGAVLAAALPQMENMPGMDISGMGDAGPSMAAMAGHMTMSPHPAPKPGDEERARALVAETRAVVERYKDYHKALADGYFQANPTVVQTQYHFMNAANMKDAETRFDPQKPSALLYLKSEHRDFTLEGVMYTASRKATATDLNSRIPLSMARWHVHTDFCAAPADKTKDYFGAHPRFGMFGSIKTREACDAARGEFYPVVFTWMIHVFPYEKDFKDIFSMNDDAVHIPGLTMR